MSDKIKFSKSKFYFGVFSYFCTNWALCIVPTVPWLFDRFKPADRNPRPLSPEVFNPPERRPSPEVFNNLEFAEVFIALTGLRPDVFNISLSTRILSANVFLEFRIDPEKMCQPNFVTKNV